MPTLGLFAVASAGTIALGSIGLDLSGVSLGSWVRNPIAYGAGLILGGALLAAGRTRRLSLGAVALTIAALAATLFVPGQSGVHRWIDIGPLHVNVAGLLLPVVIVALADMAVAGPVFLASIAMIAALLVAQPDASQASAFSVAAALLLQRRRDLSPAIRIGGMLGLAALTAIAWLRPDPLQPVPEVEDVFALLAGVSLPLAVAAALALAATSFLPLRRQPGSDRMPSGTPLAGYFIAAAIMPLFGAYPVPLVGLGMSFPVGYWLGVSLLCAPVRSIER